MTRAEWAKRKGRSSSFIRRTTRFAIYARDGFDCVYCRGLFPPDYSGAGLHLDHVVPKSKGGHSRPDNLVTACARCNASRQDGRFPCHLEYGVIGGKRRTRARIRRQLRKPLNRELGRWLARQAAEIKRRTSSGAPGPLLFWDSHPALPLTNSVMRGGPAMQPLYGARPSTYET